MFLSKRRSFTSPHQTAIRSATGPTEIYSLYALFLMMDDPPRVHCVVSHGTGPRSRGGKAAPREMWGDIRGGHT
jgi:hypothetical protein